MNIDQYYIHLEKNSKRLKVKEQDFLPLNTSEFELLKSKNYNLKQLRESCKKHGLKKTGNKDTLENKLYNYLRLSNSAEKIQKHMKGYLMRMYLRLKGPGFMNRKVCTNDTDFYSLDGLNEIPHYQFFSYEDDSNFIYGFDILSIFNMYVNNNRKDITNPYNREEVPHEVMENLKKLIRLTHILKFPLEITIQKTNLNGQQQMNQDALEIFQHINSLGNYSDSDWLLSLNINRLKIFVRELYDIWTYRAQLSNEQKREIVAPHGNPFSGVNRLTIYHSGNREYLLHKIIGIIKKMVTRGTNDSNKNLGAMYVLSALTLVNQNAANSLPWLYESVAHV